MDFHAIIGVLDHGPVEQPVTLRIGVLAMPLMGAGAPVR